MYERLILALELLCDSMIMVILIAIIKIINDIDNDNNKVSKTDDFVDVENKHARMLQGCRVTYVLRYRVQNLPIV